jgi:hypothetical protein
VVLQQAAAAAAAAGNIPLAMLHRPVMESRSTTTRVYLVNIVKGLACGKQLPVHPCGVVHIE